MRRRKNKKWKIRESSNIWKFILREVVAFFSHFFDWWSWRSSFAFVNLSIYSANQTSRNSELRDICKQHGRREVSPLTMWILEILACMTYVKRPVQDLDARRPWNFDAWECNVRAGRDDSSGRVEWFWLFSLCACHLLYIQKVTAFIPDGTRDIYKSDEETVE